MATIAPPQTSNQAGPRSKTTSRDADQLIHERIEEARRSLWWAELIRSGLKLVISAIIAILVWLVVDQWIYSPNVVVRSAVLISLLGLAGWHLKFHVFPLFGSTVRPEYAARAMERGLPELRQSLTSYVTLRHEASKSDLQTRVVQSMGSVTAGRLRSYDEVPEEAAGNFRWWITTSLAFALLLGYAVASPKNSLQSVARLAAPIAGIDPARRVTITQVLPGNVEAIAGRKLGISAVVTGVREEEPITCHWDLTSGREELALTLDPDSDRYVGELWLPHAVSGLVPYTIKAGDATEGPYYLQVQDLPVVALQSVHYEPPKYTGETAHTSSSGGITGLVGTRVRILATTNRPVSKARIEFNPRLLGDRVQATAGVNDLVISEDGTSLSFAFTLRTAKGRSAAVEQDSYRISVQDSTKQGNSNPIIYPIRVVSDLPPEVSITMPFRSPKEIPIDAQQVVEVHASDPDYGLREIRLEIRSGLDLIGEPILWSHSTGQKGNQVSEYRFRPSEHDLGIGSTVQIVALATDNRESDEFVNLEPNATRTDPIELKITAASTLPSPDDPNAGGLSAPDDRPASDHQKSPDEGTGDSKGDQTDQQQGGGGSSGSDAGDSQNGNAQGGDATSQEGGQNGEQSGDQQGGQDGNGTQSENQTSEDSQGGNAGGQDDSTGSDDQSSGTGNNSNSEGDRGDNQNTSQNPDQSNPDEGSQGQGASEGGDIDSSMNNKPESGNQDSAGNEGQQGGESHDNQNNQTASNDGSEGNQSDSNHQNANQSPEHDGEAFERIRDYLEGKQGSGTQSPPSTSGNQDAGNQDAGNQDAGNQDAGNQDAGNQDAGNQDAGNQDAGNQDAGNQDAGNQDAGNQDAGNQDAGNQDAGNQDAGNQDAGNQDAGNQDAGNHDAGNHDAGNQDAGNQDAGNQDAGNQDAGNQDAGNQDAGG